MSKKKIIKLPDGCAKGSETYGVVCKPKGGRLQSNALELRNRAAQRIIALMKEGSQADRLTRKEEPITDKRQLDDLEFRNKLAETPKIVQFAYWRGKLEELRLELKEVEDSNNPKKISQMLPTIKLQIELVENTMREIFETIQQERKIISRNPNTKEEE
jgi:hypothetical protein